MQRTDTIGALSLPSRGRRQNVPLAQLLARIGVQSIPAREARVHERQVLAAAPAPTPFARTRYIFAHPLFPGTGLIALLCGLALASPIVSMIGGLTMTTLMWHSFRQQGVQVLFPARWHEVPIADIRHIDNEAVRLRLETILRDLQSVFGDHFGIIERRLVQNWVTIDPTVWIVDTRTHERACVAIYDNDVGYLRLA